MLRNRTIVFVAILALLLGSLGLVGCTSGDDATEDTEAATEESGGDAAGSSLSGKWENADPVYYADITFSDDGTGMISDIDGESAEMTWTLVDDYLEIAIVFDDMSETTGASFIWVEEGTEFTWDADGTYTKVE